MGVADAMPRNNVAQQNLLIEAVDPLTLVQKVERLREATIIEIVIRNFS